MTGTVVPAFRVCAHVNIPGRHCGHDVPSDTQTFAWQVGF